ncbi:MAG: GIY-YIG nuclease family protein [bacterium]
MNEYFVYILRSKVFSKTYVGFTEDLQRRLYEHNSGKSTFTRKYKPWEIVFFEKYLYLDEAVKREKYYKSAAGRRKIKNIIEQNECPRSSVDRAEVS